MWAQSAVSEVAQRTPKSISPIPRSRDPPGAGKPEQAWKWSPGLLPEVLIARSEGRIHVLYVNDQFPCSSQVESPPEGGSTGSTLEMVNVPPGLECKSPVRNGAYLSGMSMTSLQAPVFPALGIRRHLRLRPPRHRPSRESRALPIPAVGVRCNPAPTPSAGCPSSAFAIIPGSRSSVYCPSAAFAIIPSSRPSAYCWSSAFAVIPGSRPSAYCWSSAFAVIPRPRALRVARRRHSL
jgi:hypothetical protein